MKTLMKTVRIWHLVFAGATGLVGLVLGLIIGANLHHLPFPGPRPGLHAGEQMLAMFSRDLKLLPEQRQKLSVILDHTHSRLVVFQKEIEPRFEAIRKSADAEIESILTTEQVARFREHKKRMAPPIPGGFPGPGAIGGPRNSPGGIGKDARDNNEIPPPGPPPGDGR